MKDRKDLADYWQERGKLSFWYRNEEFYTVGPIPVYYDRRKQLLVELNNVVAKYDRREIMLLDFGCGDGYYLEYLQKRYPGLKLFGCDVSYPMLERAGKRTDGGVELRYSDGLIPFATGFSVILIIGVLGVIMDDCQVKRLLRDAYSHAKSKGRIITFDAVANTPREGVTWKRRTEEWYIRSCEEAGFVLESKNMVAYPLYERFHKYIGRHIKGHYEKKDPFAGITMNKNHAFVKLVEVLVKLSCMFPFTRIPVKEGNCVFVFRKDE